MFNKFSSLLVGSILVSLPLYSFAEDRPVALDAKSTSPLKVGEQAPNVEVTNLEGKQIKLSSLYAEHPAVIVFFRGSWCPVCNRHMQELVNAHAEISKRGVNLVAISPDTPQHSKKNVEDHKLPFALYSDTDVVAAKAFGLAFKVDDATLTKYKGFGIDLEKACGRDHHSLPVPAVYILDKTGKVVFAHTDPDYTKRLSTAKLLEEIKKLK